MNSKISVLACFVFMTIGIFYIFDSDGSKSNHASDEASLGSDYRNVSFDSNENESTVNFGTPASLPAPSRMSVHGFEKQLYKFLDERKYQDLGWAVDKSVRDTGPYIKKQSYGTHPAVRVYYSPEVMEWLVGGRVGTIPNGAMIIKEQYEEPAVRHEGKTEEELRASLLSWTVMVKDSNGSHDGWFWSNPYPTGEERTSKVVDNHQYPFNHPESGFGHYCVRCHAATQSPNNESPSVNNEFTFSSLRNIKGFPGEPIIFRVDDSWRETGDLGVANHEAAEADIEPENEERLLEAVSLKNEESFSHPKCSGTGTPEVCKLRFNSSFAKTFNQIPALTLDDVRPIPPVTHDWVIKGQEGKQDLVTSNQCMSCHAGMVGRYGPTMFVGYEPENYGYKAPGWHISPYGEWRWTPMGLAGRDPVFFAQLESEIEMLKKEFDPQTAKSIADNLQNTCLRCHGAMGKHQFDVDKSNPDDKFSIEHMYLTAKKNKHIGHGNAKYGALGRDGISCMICHRSVPKEQPADDDRPYLQYYLETSITGNFKLGPDDEIYGPFKDDEISPYVMEHGIAVKPKHNDYIQSSRMCGTCHVVSLPVVDDPFDHQPSAEQQSLVDGENVHLFKKFHHHVEQATYLEWLNSEFENEFKTDNPKAKSCQDCHMSKDLHDDEHDIHMETIATRIATVQDSSYPDAENLTELHNLKIRLREEGYRRHNFVGLNVFLVELFRQFDQVLGVRKNDFMTGSATGIETAIKNYQRQARNDVVDLALDSAIDGSSLTATVDIKNKVGHRFPSGVGFRRAFVELLVLEKLADGSEKIVWGSGRTNENGIIVGGDGQPLKTEFFERDDDKGEQLYQPHHQIIDSENQVQIYETLLKDGNQNFTTSFIHGSSTVKDNRFLPTGWSAEGPDPALTGAYLKATHPGDDAKRDPRYTDGSGSDQIQYQIRLPAGVDTEKLVVRASVYYQAFPPYFLKNLFDNAPNGEATRRLHFMLSNADVRGTAIEDWKLLIQTAEANPTR